MSPFRALSTFPLLLSIACGGEVVEPQHQVDPCATDNGGCGPHATCSADGDMAECTCAEGFIEENETCVDIDECAFVYGACDLRATCTNTPGSYTCACDEGDLGDGSFCGQPWSAVAVGAWQSCAVRPEGTLWCWGSAADGVLGTGATDGVFNAPVQVGVETDWERVFAGTYSTCAQKEDGSLWCWGRGVYGIFGDGTKENSAVPVMTAPSHRFTSVALGLEHTCAIDEDSTLFCWGYNRDGLLGIGVVPLPTDDSRMAEPIALEGTWESVSSRHHHTCGIRTDGSLWCWGPNEWGQVGDGTTDLRTSPTRVGLDRDWVQVSAGLFATCALKSDGSAWCWGRGARFEEESGSESFQTRPVRVWEGRVWSRLHVGAYFLCGEQADGSLWCGGSNEYGQLGVGHEAEVLAEPQRVGDTSWSQVTIGQDNGCALRPEGVLQCWGAGWKGVLGTGERWPRSRTRPVAVY